MMYDPGRLAGNLEKLVKELADWSYAIKETRDMASFEQRQTEETVVQAEQHAKIIAHQLANDQEMLHKTNEALTTARALCKEGCDRARQTLTQVQNAHSHAIHTLQHWEAELEKAVAWLRRAQGRLARAIQALHIAEAALRSAESELSRARSALSSCNNDSSRKSCSGEAAAVQRAGARVATARTEVAAAQQEVQAAQQEVQAAEARVTICSRAVDFAHQAVHIAQEAEQTARQGLNFAERSLEHIEAAYKALQEANKALRWEEEEVHAMIVAIRAASTNLDDAKQHQRTAEYYENEAQRASYRAQYDIQDKVQQLYDLNRPSLYDIGNISGQRIVSFLGAAAATVAIAANIAVIANHVHNTPTLETQQVVHGTQLQSYNSAADAQQKRDEALMGIAEKATDAADASRELYEKLEKNE